MKCKMTYWLVPLIICMSCNTYHRQVASLSPDCQKLLRELKYRIITNDTGGYTFRFEYPTSATIPHDTTLRQKEYIYFIKNVLKNNNFCNCGFTYDIISKTIGKENSFYREGGRGNTNNIAMYILDFGFNCGGNKCPASTDNECNFFHFIYNVDGILVKCRGSYQAFDVEPYSCTEYGRKLITTQEYK